MNPPNRWRRELMLDFGSRDPSGLAGSETLKAEGGEVCVDTRLAAAQEQALRIEGK